jgi:hypothetical protein
MDDSYSGAVPLANPGTEIKGKCAPREYVRGCYVELDNKTHTITCPMIPEQKYLR